MSPLLATRTKEQAAAAAAFDALAGHASSTTEPEALASLAMSQEATASTASVVCSAEERSKGYLERIQRAIGDPRQCVAQSQLPRDVVAYESRHVGKVREVYMLCQGCQTGFNT